MRVLFLTSVLPAGRRTGGEAVSQAFVDALRAAGHDVVVVGYRRPGERGPAADGEVAAGERPIETSAAGPRAAVWMAHAVARRRPYSIAKYRSRGYRAVLARELARSPSLVVVDHLHSSWAAPVAAGPPVVYLAHNVEHAHYAELAAQRSGARHRVYAREQRLVRRDEERMCRRSAAVWALTAEDAAALESLGGAPAQPFTVPPTAAAAPPGRAPECDVALLGSWTWEANAAGLRWFADAVLPRLDGLSVRVAGSGAEETVGDRPGLALCGRVPDARAFLQAAKVVAVPAVAGSGIQVKTLDAIAAGRPVVGTAIAVRGIADPPGCVRVADDPEAFAGALRAAAASPPDDGGAASAVAWSRARTDRFRAEVAAAARAAAGGAT